MPQPWENPALPYAERQRLRNEYIAAKQARAGNLAAHNAALAKRAAHAAGVVKQQAKQTKITAAQQRYQQDLAKYQAKLKSYNNAAGASAMAGAFGHGFAIGPAPIAPTLPKLLQDAAGTKYVTPAPAPKPSNNEGRVTPAPSPAPAPLPAFDTSASSYAPDASSFAGSYDPGEIDAGDVADAAAQDAANPPSPLVLGGLALAALVLYAWAHGSRR